MDSAAPAAPAQPVSADPQSAAAAAVATHNFAALQEARRAERLGKPLDAVPPAAPPAPDASSTHPSEGQPIDPAAPSEPREVSKRQQRVNEDIQKAVARATADLRAENERLKAGTPPAADPPPPAPANVPDYKRYLALPDAPKLVDFDSLEEHAAAMGVFIADARHAERVAADTAATSARQAFTDAQRTIDGFQAQVKAAGGDAWLHALSAEVQALRPEEAVLATTPRGQQPRIGPLHILTSEVLKSPNSTALLQHLSDHPDDLARFADCSNRAAVHRELGKLESRLDAPSSASVSLPKTLTSAPVPVPTVNTRSSAPPTSAEALVKKRDFAGLQRLRQQERLARIRPAS